jgi:hypothetical protein
LRIYPSIKFTILNKSILHHLLRIIFTFCLQNGESASGCCTPDILTKASSSPHIQINDSLQSAAACGQSENFRTDLLSRSCSVRCLQASSLRGNYCTAFELHAGSSCRPALVWIANPNTPNCKLTPGFCMGKRDKVPGQNDSEGHLQVFRSEHLKHYADTALKPQISSQISRVYEDGETAIPGR